MSFNWGQFEPNKTTAAKYKNIKLKDYNERWGFGDPVIPINSSLRALMLIL